MTTLSEYKAMMEGATDALKAVKSTIADYGDDDPERSLDTEWGNVDVKVKHLEPIKATLELTPELIRVIELAEDAFETCGVNRHGQEYHDWDKVKNALSEIRKLKGE